MRISPSRTHWSSRILLAWPGRVPPARSTSSSGTKRARHSLRVLVSRPVMGARTLASMLV
eukprot:scaffold1345_cov223-Pinguiococcus_pyrenoidosus.AAC.4